MRSNWILRNASIGSIIRHSWQKCRRPLDPPTTESLAQSGYSRRWPPFARPAGTPQGGSCSPLLALIALHGMDQAITRAHTPVSSPMPMMGWCSTKSDRCLSCRELLKTWLAEMGLSLKEAKSRIAHTLEGDQPGFEFWDLISGSIRSANTKRAKALEAMGV